MKILPLLLLLLPLQDTKPTDPMKAVGKAVESGISAFLEGKDPAKAFEGFDTSENDADKMAELRKKMTEAGVKSADPAGADVDIALVKDKKVVHRVRTYVRMRSGRVDFFGFDGLIADEEELDEERYPLSENLKGHAAAIGKGMKALLAEVKENGKKALPMAEADNVGKKILSEKVREGFLKKCQRTMSKLDKTVEGIQGKEFDSIALRFDDLDFLTKNDSGNYIGVLSCQIRYRKGKLTLEIRRFETFPD